MSYSLQEFLAAATEKVAADLVEAFAQLPENKRSWRPADAARSAIDMVAECAVLNGYTANLIQTRVWSPGDFKTYEADKAEAISQGWDVLHALLLDSTRTVAAAIAAVPEEDLLDKIEVPGNSQTVAQIMARQYWNLTYHLGQVNYIASLLGPLD